MLVGGSNHGPRARKPDMGPFSVPSAIQWKEALAAHLACLREWGNEGPSRIP